MNFNLPIRIIEDKDYYIQLRKTFRNYKKEIETLSIDSSTVKETKKICDSILRAVRAYYDSKISTSYNIVKNIIEKVIKQYPQIICPINKLSDYKNPGLFFKARIGEDKDDITAQTMLHIPFYMRSKVQNYRFSVNGCPCIYLGKSSYITWLEMGKPSFSNFYVSGFQLNEGIKVLNLTKPNWEDFFNQDTIEKYYYILFPIIIATSFTVREEGRHFKSEYIISQLITQVIAQKNIDGIAYVSKRINDIKSVFPINVCIALITKQKKEQPYMDIEGKIAVCRPYNFSEYLLIPKDQLDHRLKSFSESTEVANCSFANKTFFYANTVFWEFDEYIKNKEMNHIII